jgi:hypothetical protein
MASLQGKYEEYRRLNQEVSFHRENAERNRNYCITLFAALSGFAIKESIPALFVIAWGIVFYYWRTYNITYQNTVKISRYISAYLEGEDTGLHWETRVEEKGQPTARSRVVSASCTSPHAIMSLACLVGLIVYCIPWRSSYLWALIGSISALLAIGLNCLLALKISNKPWAEMRKEWRRFWEASPPQG